MNPLRSYFCCAGFICAVGVCAAEDPAAQMLGPTELQDTFLPSQVRYQSYPESAVVLDQGRWRANVTVDWTAQLAQTATYLFDGESVTTTFKLRYAPCTAWEVGFDVPHTVRIDGSADRFIEFVETTLNAKVDARYALPRDTYQASLAGPNGTAMTLRKDHDLQDATVRLKHQLVDHVTHWLDAAAVATLTLPSGGDTFGGEGFSPGLGVHAQKPFRTVNLFTGGAVNYYSDSTEQLFHFNPWRGMAYGGMEWKPLSWGALVGAYQIYTPFASSNPPLDEIAHYYSVTGRFWLGKSTVFETGVVENLGLIENRNSSDVTFKFSLTTHF